MKKRIAAICTVAALAGVGAAQVLVWFNAGIVHLLVISPAAWAVEDAVHAAPIILACLLGAGLMTVAGWLNYEDVEGEEGYGRIRRTHARNPESPEDREEWGA